MTLETVEGLTTMTKLVVSMKLILTEYTNKHHSYVVPCCIFYPKTPVNILGVPALGSLFSDSEDATDILEEDGTNIKSCDTK